MLLGSCKGIVVVVVVVVVVAVVLVFTIVAVVVVVVAVVLVVVIVVKVALIVITLHYKYIHYTIYYCTQQLTSKVVPDNEEELSLAVLASAVFNRKVTEALTVSSQPCMGEWW